MRQLRKPRSRNCFCLPNVLVTRWRRIANFYEEQRERTRQADKTPNEKDLQPMPRRQLDGLRGSKYPGNGISGNFGRARYASLLRWLGKHLYDMVGDRRTMGIIKERRVYLSSLVSNMV